MKKILYILLPVLLLMSISACDIIDKDDILTPIKNDTTEVTNKRVILIEEFTGNKCPNCPKAANEAEKLMKMYPGQVVVMAIHAGYFAVPTPAIGYKEDFRTPEGTEIHNKFGLSQYPMGIINRTQHNGSYLTDFGEWESIIATLSQDTSKIEINVEPTYDALSYYSTIKIETKVSSIYDYTTLKLCAFITEDNLVCQQANDTEIDTAFVHDHVLRGSYNGTWGTPCSKGTSSIMYSKQINSNWNPDNCHIVVYVYDANSLEIYQVKEVNLK